MSLLQDLLFCKTELLVDDIQSWTGASFLEEVCISALLVNA